MSGISGFTEQEVWNAIFKDTAPSLDTGEIYVSLHTADEGNNPDGTEEVDAASYDRVAVPAADWEVTGDGPTVAENTAEINFGDPQEEWGNVTHFAIWTEDEGVEGEEPLSSTQELDVAQDIDANTDEVRFDPNDLQATID